MSNHSFVISGCDTDSISFCKRDMSPFSKEEREGLIGELNALLPDKIRIADDGYFKTVIILKAKNYILQTEDGKIKVKGSALKDAKKEIALREFLNKCIDLLLADKQTEMLPLYHEYIKEIHNVHDMFRWASKRSYTEKIDSSERTNETKVLDALEGSEYVVGDKIRLYFTTDEKLKLVEKWDINNPDHDTIKMCEKLYKTVQVFANIMDLSEFKNYKLKKNQKELKELWTN